MMQQKVMDAIDLGTRNKLVAMMFKKAVEVLVEHMKEFTRAVADIFMPVIRQLMKFAKWINRVNDAYRLDGLMIARWENEGGALHG